MRKLIMWNLVTLDGFFEGEKPWDLAFHQIAWGKELQAYTTEQLDSAFAVIYGTKTYQGMADYWTNSDDEKAEQMNSIKKFVCSKSLKKADWNNTEIISDALTEIPKLKEGEGGNLFVFGSATLSESLMKANLYDEYRICVVPVFLGKGRRLFDDGLPYKELKLLNFRPLKSGAIILTYAPN